ncbi:MAG: sensor histidine kinase [Clostridia bacterium]|nr:sensor histidine kinase [Clostridia bacterium]
MAMEKSAKMRMQGKLWNMILTVALPLMLVIVVIASIGIWYAWQYNAILNNVTTASDFNQNFKDDVDLKMYYYVIDSQYSEGLPIEEVQSAEAIARKLIDMSTEKESMRAITSVLNLCHNLEEKIHQIAATEDYEARQEQLENNIYILTDLIQEYMYTYLYYEAVHLDTLQSRMISSMIALMTVILIMALILLVVLLSRSRNLSRKIVDPVDKLCRRLEDIGSGKLAVCDPIQADVAEVQLLSDGIEQMVGHLQRLIAENTEQEKQRRHAELALLQAQINPHFLYNTMDTIIWLIESGDVGKAVTMINSLSNFFRFSLSRGQSIITLAEEEQHIRSYLEIQQVRYRDLMEYEIDIPNDLKQYMLPKLTLQPLVENALYHGIKMKRRKGSIRVSGSARDGNIFLAVRDDGTGMTAEKLHALQESLTEGGREGFGLRTVHQRLQILFGKAYGLTLASTPDEGTTVTVTIPMQMNDKEAEA